jgi:PKD repeat protein
MKRFGHYALLVMILPILNIACKDEEEPQKEAPVANFSFNTGLGTSYIPTFKEIAFNNESTGEISSYSWNFDGRANSNEEDPIYTFHSMGIKQVTLTVEGPGGQHSLTKELEVNTGKITIGSVDFYPTNTKGYYCQILAAGFSVLAESSIKQPSAGVVTWTFTQSECQFTIISPDMFKKGNSTFDSFDIRIYDSNHSIQASGIVMAEDITLERPQIVNATSNIWSVKLNYE